MERATIVSPQVVELKALRDRILFDLKLGILLLDTKPPKKLSIASLLNLPT
jgi:hypothetical protein